MFKSKSYDITIEEVLFGLDKESNSDIKVLTSNSPLLVRYITKDNLYKTFKIQEEEDSEDKVPSVEVVATNSADKISDIDKFVRALKVQMRPKTLDKIAEREREERKKNLQHFNKLEAEYYNKKSSGLLSDEIIKSEYSKLQAFRELIERGESILGSTLELGNTLTRKERAKKARANRKKK